MAALRTSSSACRDRFPPRRFRRQPVTIDQRGCMYVPRVVGAQVGQTVQVRNSDELLHNVHGTSTHGNAFNFSQPKAGIVQELRLKDPEIMLRVACDVHRWMTAFVGVVNHPYFATSGAAWHLHDRQRPRRHSHHPGVARTVRGCNADCESHGRINDHGGVHVSYCRLRALAVVDIIGVAAALTLGSWRTILRHAR